MGSRVLLNFSDHSYSRVELAVFLALSFHWLYHIRGWVIPEVFHDPPTVFLPSKRDLSPSYLENSKLQVSKLSINYLYICTFYLKIWTLIKINYQNFSCFSYRFNCFLGHINLRCLRHLSFGCHIFHVNVWEDASIILSPWQVQSTKRYCSFLKGKLSSKSVTIKRFLSQVANHAGSDGTCLKCQPALRQEDRLKFRANLAYTVHSRSPRAVKEDSVSKTKQKWKETNKMRKEKLIMCYYYSKL